MPFRPVRALPALALAVVTALIAGCSKDDSTSPTPPVTGPTFSFAFPASGVPGAPGTSNKLVFTDIGGWNYHCIPHASIMQGTVNVVASGAANGDSIVVHLVGNTLGSLAYSPAVVTINQGGYVRWINESSFTTHTVTRP